MILLLASYLCLVEHLKKTMENSRVKVCVAVTWQSAKKTQPRCKMLQSRTAQ